MQRRKIGCTSPYDGICTTGRMKTVAWQPACGTPPVKLRLRAVPLKSNCGGVGVVLDEPEGGGEPAAFNNLIERTAGADHTKPTAIPPAWIAFRRGIR